METQYPRIRASSSCCRDERWADCLPGRYSVSTCGRVRNDITGTIRALTHHKGRRGGLGHLTVDWEVDHKRFYPKVHILVLEAFVESRPEGLQGLHRDDDRTNNHLANLYWGTQADNMQDRIRNGNNPWLNGTARRAVRATV